MNKRIVRAALVACLLGSAAALAVTVPLSPAYAKASGPVLSTPVLKLLAPAQKLIQANDFAGAMVLLKQAQALPDQTPVDIYQTNSLIANASLGLKDYATAEIAYEAMADSPAMPDDEKSPTIHNATLLADTNQHFDKVIKYGVAYEALGGPPDPIVLAFLARAYYTGNDYVNAEATAQKAVAATPAGQPPKEFALQVLLNSQFKLKQTDAAMKTIELLVTYYDNPDQWGNLLIVSLGTKGIKDVDAVHMYRLGRLAKTPAHSDEDYTVPAAMALSVGYPVEAQAILEEGIAAGVVSAGGKNGAQIADTRGRAAKDRSTIAGFDAVARKSPNGELDLKLAETYYGYARYAEAEEAARRALTKGGAKADPNEANMVLGEALLREGKTADALAAFNAVHNATPGMTQAQHLWLLYANRKPAPAAAP